MKKLINIPDVIDKILKGHKVKTGISVASYIIEAIIKKMVHDRLITIKTTTVFIDKKTGRVLDIENLCEKCDKSEKKFIKINAPDESLKYCDGDKCSV